MEAVQMILSALTTPLMVLSVPLVLLGLFAHFAAGVSLHYMLRCFYLEFLLRWKASKLPDPPAKKADRYVPPNAGEEKLRGVAVPSWKEYSASGQVGPPTKRVESLFPKGQLPHGEELAYSVESRFLKGGLMAMPLLSSFGGSRRQKESAVEGVEEDEAWTHKVNCLREGAEVHRQVRQYVQQKVRPGKELRQIVEMVENASSTLVGFDAKNPLRRSFAFPTGLSLNECAAHDTVNPGDEARWLLPTDLAKLDFGVQIDGHILDCAFSFTFCDLHDELMQAVKEATNAGIRFAGPDALLNEMGAAIQEVMESAEVHRPDGKVLPIYSIKNLTGHSIAPYKIHAGKSIPSCNTGGSARMKCGELWAIETFGSAGGIGYVVNSGPSSHFMRGSLDPPRNFQLNALSSNAKTMLELIDKRFGTLAFCPRWVLQEATRSKTKFSKVSTGRGSGGSWWEDSLHELCNMGIVTPYPPLSDLPGCHTAQYEHTILLRGSGKEVLTRGSDY